MNNPINVYVFVSGSRVNGLTLDRSGRNLPELENNSAWVPAFVTTLTVADLQRHTLDAQGALRDLQTRGFHIAPLTAQMVQFPQPHRQAS